MRHPHTKDFGIDQPLTDNLIDPDLIAPHIIRSNHWYAWWKCGSLLPELAMSQFGWELRLKAQFLNTQCKSLTKTGQKLSMELFRCLSEAIFIHIHVLRPILNLKTANFFVNSNKVAFCIIYDHCILTCISYLSLCKKSEWIWVYFTLSIIKKLNFITFYSSQINILLILTYITDIIQNIFAQKSDTMSNEHKQNKYRLLSTQIHVHKYIYCQLLKINTYPGNTIPLPLIIESKHPTIAC